MFEKYIDQNSEQMISSLQSLLRIPSVLGPASEGAPFGIETVNALNYVLKMAEEFGFTVKNLDGYAGYVEYGDGEEYVAVLSHLDVVPAGAGWTSDPFAAEVVGDRIVSRGAIDDKGPAMSSLWALYGLKSLELKPKRKIRLIFGLDEETDWRCMEHFFAHEPQPLGGFTPDGDFPFIFAEKGVATIRVSIPADKDSLNPRIIQFDGGQRDNMVPDFASAVIDCHSETAAIELEQKLFKDARQHQMDINVQVNGSTVGLSVHGISAHGSLPDLGVNAVVRIATLLAANNVSNGSMWHTIAGQDTRGKSLGIDSADEVTGELSSNLGRAYLEGSEYTFLFNIRYPIDMTAEELVNRFRGYVSDKWSVSLQRNIDPLYVPLDNPVIRALTKVYEERTGDVATPLAIGGATYARAIPNAVAFGALFPGEPDLAHQKDEYMLVKNYLRCIDIYAHAMWELANTL